MLGSIFKNILPAFNTFTQNSNPVITEAQRIQKEKENGNISYLDKNEKHSKLRTTPLNIKEIAEIVCTSINLTNVLKIPAQNPVICMGRSPRWFAECFKMLNFKNIAFNYSGQPYLQLLNNEYQDEDQDVVKITVTDVKEMRKYLTLCGLNVNQIFKNEHIYLMDYISGGGSLLSFIYFITHWFEDEKKEPNHVSDPLTWLEKEETKKIIESIIPKIRMIQIGGLGSFSDNRQNKKFHEQIEMLNKQIYATITKGTYTYDITHNHDHTLGFKLPVEDWNHATDWLTYEQYPDPVALKTKEQFQHFIDTYKVLITMHPNDDFVKKNLFKELKNEISKKTSFDQWVKIADILRGFAQEAQNQKVSLGQYFEDKKIDLGELITRQVGSKKRKLN